MGQHIDFFCFGQLLLRLRIGVVRGRFGADLAELYQGFRALLRAGGLVPFLHDILGGFPVVLSGRGSRRILTQHLFVFAQLADIYPFLISWCAAGRLCGNGLLLIIVGLRINRNGFRS